MLCARPKEQNTVGGWRTNKSTETANSWRRSTTPISFASSYALVAHHHHHHHHTVIITIIIIRKCRPYKYAMRIYTVRLNYIAQDKRIDFWGRLRDGRWGICLWFEICVEISAFVGQLRIIFRTTPRVTRIALYVAIVNSSSITLSTLAKSGLWSISFSIVIYI